MAPQKSRWHASPLPANGQGVAAANVLLRRLDQVLNDKVAYLDDDLTFTGTVTFTGPLAVNPGPLVVGTDPGGSEILRVGGSVRASVSVVTPALYSPAATALNFGDALTNRWQVAVGGHLIAITDATLDIGQPGANRPRSGYFSTNFFLGVAPPSIADLNIGRAGRSDFRLYDSTAGADEKLTDVFSLDGLGGASTFFLGITRTDTGTAGQVAIRLGRVGNTWSGLTLMASGGAVVIGTDPGGSQTLRVGGAANVSGILSGSAGTFSTAPNGQVSISGSTAELALSPRSGGGANWELYSPATASFRLYHTSDQFIFTDTDLSPASAGGKTLGTASLPWGDLRSSGVLYLSASAAKVVPGATSLAFRNTADSADNILISDGGDVTVRTRFAVGIAEDDTIGCRLYGAGVGTSGTFPFGVIVGSTVTAGANSHTARMMYLLNGLATGGFSSVTFVGLEIDNISGGASNYALVTGTGLVSFGDTVNTTGVYQKGGTQVVGARQTGYTAMTGTKNRGTAYATGTITLVQLAERVGALQDDLATHGLIGA